MTGTVYVRRAGKSRNVPPDIARTLDPRLNVLLVEDSAGWADRGDTDIYITRARLHHKTEAAAAEMGAVVVVLPEAAEYFARTVLDRCLAGSDVWVFQPQSLGDRL